MAAHKVHLCLNLLCIWAPAQALLCSGVHAKAGGYKVVPVAWAQEFMDGGSLFERLEMRRQGSRQRMFGWYEKGGKQGACLDRCWSQLAHCIVGAECVAS